jgi:hypothetical protein
MCTALERLNSFSQHLSSRLAFGQFCPRSQKQAQSPIISVAEPSAADHPNEDAVWAAALSVFIIVGILLTAMPSAWQVPLFAVALVSLIVMVALWPWPSR